MYLKFAWNDWAVKIPVFISVFLVLLSFILTGYVFIILNAEATESLFAVLHSSIYFGVDRIADPWQTFLIPTAGLVFFVLNLFIADRLWKISYFYTRLVLVSAAFTEFFCFLACVSLLKWNV
jgi:hypothetical protein